MQTDQRTLTHGYGNTTTSIECVSSKVWKSPRGLKIHQAKMNGMQTVQVSHRSGTTPDKTREKPGKQAVSKQ